MDTQINQEECSDDVETVHIPEVDDLEWSADQEILLLYSLHGYKPVGPNKHFRMLLIQERLSNAMNKNISAPAIWNKLKTLYDLEALDEAEAEADALDITNKDFSLPEDEFGKLMKSKKQIKTESLDPDYEIGSSHQLETVIEIKQEKDLIYNSETDNALRLTPAGKEQRKDKVKKWQKKQDLTPVKDSLQLKKDNFKESPKKEIVIKKENVKEAKKLFTKEDEKKDVGKKTTQEIKKEITKEDKKELMVKVIKKEPVDKRLSDQIKKDTEIKKADQKKVIEPQKIQRTEAVKTRPETPKPLRADSNKRAETKTPKTETMKTQRNEATMKPQRLESLKKESTEKKKETLDKKVERKSPEKTPESARGSKLRTREKKEESDKIETPTGAKRERSRDSLYFSKASESLDEPPAKKVKTSVPKGRSTRNSIEPQKPASPAVNPSSPQKRRTR